MLKTENKAVFQRPSAKLSPEEMELAKKYLQGAVHSFCKNNPGEWFSLRDLVGGENKDWGGTPLQPIYDYYISNGKTVEKAKKQAAVDAGWLLKTVLVGEGNRLFEQKQGPRSKLYRKID